MADVARFYDDLSASYHLLFDDWDKSIAWQAETLDNLLTRLCGAGPKTILDAACGIGTQALGFAAKGHKVDGSDLSPAAITRAKREAERKALKLRLTVADLRVLSGYHSGPYDVVCALDNALPHLEGDEDLEAAVREMTSLLGPGGLFLASIRDYESAQREKPRTTEPKVFGGGDRRRVVFQVWDWRRDDRGYRINQYIIQHQPDGLAEVQVFTTTYWKLSRQRLSTILEGLGLQDVRWLEPAETGYYQPIVAARTAASS